MTTEELEVIVPALLIKRRMGEKLTKQETTILAFTADAGDHGQRSFTNSLYSTDYPALIDKIDDEFGGFARIVEHEGTAYVTER